MESDLTVDSLLLSTLHDRERRHDRQIPKVDQQSARRYGMVEHGKWPGSLKYSYGGMVFVYDKKRNKAITSMRTSKNSFSQRSGTRKQNPILLKESIQHNTTSAKKMHNRAKNKFITMKEKWKTHTVLIIDMSGSMRTDDINGGRCRSDAVWMVLARDFVMRQLESQAVNILDMVSIVLMSDDAEVYCCYEPIDWVLYNKLVDLREWTTVKPRGHGYYLKALKKAEKLLNYNNLGSCSLSLMFFSDGSPSDSQEDISIIPSVMADIAAQFGRRLTVTCVGIAESHCEDFSILRTMIEECKQYGCKAFFNKPSLSSESLSSIVSEMGSSLASSKTELTSIKTKQSMIVRSDVCRERQDAPDDKVLTNEWKVYQASDSEMLTLAAYVWNDKASDFATVIDPRCIKCFHKVADEDLNIIHNSGIMCQKCKSCFLCNSCVQNQKTYHECVTFAHQRRNGLIVKKKIPSFCVAYKKKAFGEGAERFAFKFRFVDPVGSNRFIGPKMVAKESRFLEEKGEDDKSSGEYLFSHKHSYHRNFMRTQALASRFANIYNKALDLLEKNHFHARFYPRIHFLEAMVFELRDVRDDNDCKIIEHNILVEPMIEDEYRKYSNNYGKHEPQILPLDFDKDDFVSEEDVDFLLGRKLSHPPKLDKGNDDLGMIAECSDEDESSDEECIEQSDNNGISNQIKAIPDEEFVEAFSHFSYVRSKGEILVVDLQGTFKVHSDMTREYIFTDPAIHKRRKKGFFRGMNFGRTNLGRTGINNFWEAHVCNDACRILGLRPYVRNKPLASRASS